MKLGFIGCGKITSSVIAGISKSSIKYDKILISERNKKISKALKKKHKKIYIEKNNQNIVDNCNWVFLAITPTVDQKLIDNFSFLISTVEPILSKNFLTFLFGGQIGTGPFFKEIGGNGIALTIFAFTFIILFSSVIVMVEIKLTIV